MPTPLVSGQMLGRRGCPRSGGIRTGSGWQVEQRVQDPPSLLDRVLAAETALVSSHCRMQKLLVGSRHSLAVAAEVNVQLDRPKSGPIGSLGMQHPARARSGVDEQDHLVRIDDLVGRRETQ